MFQLGIDSIIRIVPWMGGIVDKSCDRFLNPLRCGKCYRYGQSSPADFLRILFHL